MGVICGTGPRRSFRHGAPQRVEGKRGTRRKKGRSAARLALGPTRLRLFQRASNLQESWDGSSRGEEGKNREKKGGKRGVLGQADLVRPFEAYCVCAAVSRGPKRERKKRGRSVEREKGKGGEGGLIRRARSFSSIASSYHERSRPGTSITRGGKKKKGGPEGGKGGKQDNCQFP